MALVSVEKRNAFTGRDISEFCKITGDPNVLHSPEAMNEMGKLAIVPGMLTFAYAVGIVPHDFLTGANRFQAYFGGPLAQDESADFAAKQYNKNEFRLYAVTEKGDILSSKDGYTMIAREQEHRPRGLEAAVMRREITKKDLYSFSGIIEANRHVRSYLFAIAGSSEALFRCINNPQSGLEKEVNEKFKQNIYPVYVSLDIRGEQRDVKPGDIIYIAQIAKRNDKDYIFIVKAFQGELLFYGMYSFRMVHKEKVLERMAKNIEVQHISV